jgi:hypothetical protein
MMTWVLMWMAAGVLTGDGVSPEQIPMAHEEMLTETPAKPPGDIASAAEIPGDTTSAANASEDTAATAKAPESTTPVAKTPKEIERERRKEMRSGGYLLDGSPRRRPHQAMSMFGYYCDSTCWSRQPKGRFAPVGNFGFRWHMPILHNGFIPGVNEWFGLELGVDFNFWGHKALTGMSEMTDFAITFLLPVEAFWGFRFTPKIAAYVKLGAGLKTADWVFGRYTENFHHSIVPISQVGLMLFRGFTMRLETGFPQLINLTFGGEFYIRS